MLFDDIKNRLGIIETIICISAISYLFGQIDGVLWYILAGSTGTLWLFVYRINIFTLIL